MKSKALHCLFIKCTGNSASRAREGSCLSLMSKTSQAKEICIFPKILTFVQCVWVWLSLFVYSILATKTWRRLLFFPCAHVLFFLLSIGGSLPIVFAYFSEFLSREKRGEHLSWLCMFWMIGGIFASAMAWSIIPHYGNWFVLLTIPHSCITTLPQNPAQVSLVSPYISKHKKPYNNRYLKCT